MQIRWKRLLREFATPPRAAALVADRAEEAGKKHEKGPGPGRRLSAGHVVRRSLDPEVRRRCKERPEPGRRGTGPKKMFVPWCKKR